MSSINDIVDVVISASAKTPTREGFGTPAIAAYHTHWNDRSRSYTGTAAMAADGFGTWEPAYKAAQAIFSQNPSPTRVKILRRALPFTQVIELTPSTPSAGKVYDLTLNGHDVTYTALISDTLASLCTALAAACNAQNEHDADAIHSGGSTAGVQTIAAAGFTGVIAGATMRPPRSLELVLSNHTDWDATTAVISGLDYNGNAITENFAIPNNGNATVTGTKLFASVTSISIPAQTGTGGTFTLGVRARFTADGSSATKVVITSTDAGIVHTYADLTADLAIFDATTDPGIATDLDAIRAADSDWYGLLLDSNSKAETLAAAAWSATLDLIFCAQSADTACKDSSSTTDIFARLKALSYGRTAPWFHPNVGTDFLGAGIMGNRFVDDPGSDTWKFKTVAGVSVYTLTDTEEANLKAKNANIYVDVAGIDITQEGVMASGEFIDVVRGIDWFRARLRERVFFVLANNKKVPYTDAGVELIKGEVRAQIGEGITVGLFSPTPKPTVTAPLVADISPLDRATRLLPDIDFSATLAGAVHAVKINGKVTV